MSQIDLEAPNGKKISLNTGLWINNEFVKATGGQTITSINPSNETEITKVEAASAEDIDTAVKAARAAFEDPSWRDLPASGRGYLMNKLADLIERESENLATLDTWDMGKPYKDALGDLGDVVTTIRYYAGWADKNFGQVIPVSNKKFAYTVKQPVGVCGQIIPWNFPMLMVAWKLGPALACGNTIVMKAAEQSPLSILHFAPLVKEAGFPPGVVNIVNGVGREAGAALAGHPGIDKIAFTGSTFTGKSIMKAASANMTNVTLETGGKSALIIFPDADLNQAAKYAQTGIMFNAGQICTATSRVFAHESIIDQVTEKLKQNISSTNVVGDPFDAKTFQGPQVTQTQYDKVLGYVKAGLDEGAKLATGGNPYKGAKDGKGFFIEPTVFTGVGPQMKIYKEEIFGPFVVLVPFKDEAEVIKMANDTTYGLGASLFSKDVERCHRVASRLDSGSVWVNSANDSDPRVPFGGVKQSGIGRELGAAGLEGYCVTKSVHINMTGK